MNQENDPIIVNRNQKPPFLLKLSKFMGMGAMGLAAATAFFAIVAIFVPPLVVPAVILGIGAITAGSTSYVMKNTYNERMKTGFYNNISSDDVIDRMKQIELEKNIKVEQEAKQAAYGQRSKGYGPRRTPESFSQNWRNLHNTKASPDMPNVRNRKPQRQFDPRAILNKKNRQNQNSRSLSR